MARRGLSAFHLGPIFLAVLAGVPAGGETAPALAPAAATFLIERVSVEGIARGQAAIVAGESLLKPGGTYNEGELRDAVYRVKRLPFVLSADFSLRKGSVRGSYELVIKVVATKPFFFSVDAIGQRYRDLTFGGVGDFGWNATSSLGARQTIGPFGEAFLQWNQTDYDYGRGSREYQVGYNQYNLLGRGAVASVVYTQSVPSLFGSRRRLQLELTVPVSGNHALQVGVTGDRYESVLGDVTNRSQYVRSSVGWMYDDTDDPVSARDGQRVEATLTYYTILNDPRYGAWESALAISRYRPLTDRQSWSLLGQMSAYRSSFGGTSTGTTGDLSIGVGHALELFGKPWSKGMNRLRLETRASFTWNRYYGPGIAEPVVDRSWTYGLGAGLVFRNPWGIVRATFDYGWTRWSWSY